jgi:O-antigen ligase
LFPVLVAATVFAFACGSSSVHEVTRIGHGGRWAMLGLLFAAAALRAVAARRFVPARGPAIAAAALVALALVSSGWSVSPRISFERGASLGLLLATVLLLVAGESSPRRLLVGLVAGSVAVGVAGLVLLAADHRAAVQPASYEFPARFQGFGQNANTAALLFAVALAPAVCLAIEAPRRAFRAVAIGVVALLVGSIVASGSRGALFAGGAGALVAVLAGIRPSRRAGLGGAIVAAAIVAGLLIQNLPKPSPTSGSGSASTTAVAPAPPPKPRYLNAEAAYPLEADIGGPLPGGGQPTIRRSFFGGSGRLEAWAGALHQILQRPLLGFGFGTDVFVDRYYYFVGGSPENSYLGIALQLGAAGLAALLVLLFTLVASVRRTLSGPQRPLVAAGLGAVVAGVAVAIVQSYVYSVGDIATATFWICAFLLPALGSGTPRA